MAALPVDAVALRLGPAGARVPAGARRDDEPFVPRLPADALEEAIELDYPVSEIEPLAFVLRGLVDRALADCAARSLACAGLTLRLALDPRGLDVRTVPIAAPTREAATLLELVRLDLARRPPGGAVVGARLIALPARVRATQLDILRPAGPAPDRLAATSRGWRRWSAPKTSARPPSRTPGARRRSAVVRPSRGARASRGLSTLAGRRRSRVAGGPRTGDETLSRAAPLPPDGRRAGERLRCWLDADATDASAAGATPRARVLIAAGPYRLRWRVVAPPRGIERLSTGEWDMHASDGAVYRVPGRRRDGSAMTSTVQHVAYAVLGSAGGGEG